MKKIQKLILPVLILAAIYLIYTFYFASKDELGSFSTFDPNNSAVKEIRVILLHDREIEYPPQGGATFYAADRDNVVILVNADKFSGDLNNATTLLLQGHLSAGGSSFHAHDVEVE